MVNLRILYMEDREDMRNGLDNYFQSKGFDVKFVEDFGDFQKEFPQYVPNVIIIDHDIKGNTYFYEVFQIVHRFRLKEKKPMVLIGCTGLPDVKNIRKEYRIQGYDEFFENDGSNEHLDNILKFVEKKLKILLK